MNTDTTMFVQDKHGVKFCRQLAAEVTIPDLDMINVHDAFTPSLAMG